MEEHYRNTTEQLVENLDNENLEEVLLRYVQENPHSIMMALYQNPDPRAVHLISGMLREKKRQDDRDFKLGIAQTLVTLPLIWVKGLQAGIWATRTMIAVSAYYATSTLWDMRTSYQMEERVRQAIYSGQISKERGTALLESISEMRPLSYVSLGLCALSGAASATRLRQLGDLKRLAQIEQVGGTSLSKTDGIRELTLPKIHPTTPSPPPTTSSHISIIPNYLYAFFCHCVVYLFAFFVLFNIN